MDRYLWLLTLVMVLQQTGCANQISPLYKLQAQRHYEYGLSYLYLQNSQAAYEEFKRALELDPEEAKIHEGMGLTKVQLNENDSALIEFKRALELDPGLASTYQCVSDLYIKQGEWDKAIEYARRALALPWYTQSYQAHYTQGVALFNLHKYQQAQQEFVIALELAPQWVEAQMWLGKCLFAQNQTSLAIIEYRKALAKAQLNWYEPDTPLLADLHYQLGMAYVDKGYLEQGLAEFQHSLAVYPSSKAELAIKNMPHNKPLAREDR